MQIEPSLSYYQMMMPHTTNLIDLEVVATSVSGTIDNRQSTIDNRQSTIAMYCREVVAQFRIFWVRFDLSAKIVSRIIDESGCMMRSPPP
jgi:hypothetical protein